MMTRHTLASARTGTIGERASAARAVCERARQSGTRRFYVQVRKPRMSDIRRILRKKGMIASAPGIAHVRCVLPVRFETDPGVASSTLAGYSKWESRRGVHFARTFFNRATERSGERSSRQGSHNRW